jgi:hypothetical protein
VLRGINETCETNDFGWKKAPALGGHSARTRTAGEEAGYRAVVMGSAPAPLDGQSWHSSLERRGRPGESPGQFWSIQLIALGHHGGVRVTLGA